MKQRLNSADGDQSRYASQNDNILIRMRICDSMRFLHVFFTACKIAAVSSKHLKAKGIPEKP